MKTIKKYKTLILFGIITLLVVILFYKGCGNTNNKKEINTTFRDSMHYHIRTTDTTYFDSTIIHSINVKVIKSYYDTIGIDTNGVVKYNSIYNNEVRDSLINGNIYSKIANDGTLVDQKFTYKALFPKYITVKDSTYIKDSTHTLSSEKWSLLVGAQTTMKLNNVGLSLIIGLEQKRKLYQIGYDPFNKAITVGINYKLYINKK